MVLAHVTKEATRCRGTSVTWDWMTCSRSHRESKPEPSFEARPVFTSVYCWPSVSNVVTWEPPWVVGEEFSQTHPCLTLFFRPRPLPSHTVIRVLRLSLPSEALLSASHSSVGHLTRSGDIWLGRQVLQRSVINTRAISSILLQGRFLTNNRAKTLGLSQHCKTWG